MRGLRIFVRPIEPGDEADVRVFLEREGFLGSSVPRVLGSAPPEEPRNRGTEEPRNRGTEEPTACGLLGKLLGEIVAVAGMEITDDAVRVRDLVVARELRRKWIGKVMMREVEQLALKMDRRRLIVDDARGAQEFLRRVGFQVEGERWVRVVP